eukprot:NP_498185.2 Uncharacterized kinase-like protein D1044.1 [Caenorhabditis elegans]
MSEIAEVVPKIIEAIFSSVQEPFKTVRPSLQHNHKTSGKFEKFLVRVLSNSSDSKLGSTRGQGGLPDFCEGIIPRISAINAACDPDNADENMEILRTLTAQEVTFYSDFSGIQFSGFPIPRSYYGENLGNEKMAGLACEDYSGKVYSIDFVPGFDESQVLQLLEALAHFHAKIIEISDEIPWKNYENVLYDAAYIRMLHNDTLDFEKLCPAELSGRIQEVKHAFDEDGVRNSEKKNEKLGMPLVICHNDLNASNVLWNNETGKIQAFIDFQHVSKGPVSFDIIRILCLGLSVENRRANTQRYLNHYYTTFKSHFSTAPFTFSQLEESYRTHFNFVNATSLFSLSYYYKMYKDESLDLKSGADEREHKAQEILRRTIGILDDM